MKKMILITALLCSFNAVSAQDANKKDKSSVSSSQKANAVAAPALEPAHMLTIDASVVRDGNIYPVAPTGGMITIDASKTQNAQEQKVKYSKFLLKNDQDD